MTSSDNPNVRRVSLAGETIETCHQVPEHVERYVLDTYGLRDEDGDPCETLDQMFVRVVNAVGGDGRLVNDDVRVLLNLMKMGVWYPNVVFFMNAGTEVKNLGACYVLNLQDTVEDIAAKQALAILIQTQGGGVGINFSNLRPKGSLIKSNKGRASGPVNIMKGFDAHTEWIKAGGRRRGANIGVLNATHDDIWSFITVKNESGVLENFNLSVLVDNDFMHKATMDLSSDEADIFHGIVHQAWKTGDPGLLFYNRLNEDNRHPEDGDINVTNPCSEVCLPAPAACNLASIDVSKFMHRGMFQMQAFREVARLVARFLNAALDAGRYVTDEIHDRMQKYRPVGVGIMGFADLLLRMEIRYGSDDSLDIATVLAQSLQQSVEEQLPDAAIHTALAPTGTLARMAGCSHSIEPVYAFEQKRKNITTGEETIECHWILDELEKEDEGCEDLPEPAPSLPDYVVDAYNVTPEEHVKVVAAFQKYVDGGVSKTVNLPNSATKEDVRNVFISAWKSGCKGITVFRDGCKDVQIIERVDKPAEMIKVDLVVGDPSFNTSVDQRRRLPDTRPSETHKFTVGTQEGYMTVGMYPGEREVPGEVFLTLAQQGTLLGGFADAVAVLLSLCLQYGVPLEDLVKKFQYVKFEPSGLTANKDIPFARSIIAYIFKWLGIRFLGHPTAVEDALTKPDGVRSGEVCPECHGELIHQGGCLECSCGFSHCG